jgi:hypothetical protein
MFRKYVVFLFLTVSVLGAYGQYDNGMLLDVIEVDLEMMVSAKLNGAEAVLKVIEQFVDSSYRYAYISRNYLVPKEQERYLELGTSRMMITVSGYPQRNNLIYGVVFFDKSFFVVILCRNENDFVRTQGMQLTRYVYDKGDKTRRENVRNEIQKNNIYPLGVAKRFGG